MNYISHLKLQIAFDYLNNHLKEIISQSAIISHLSRIKIDLSDGASLYVQYNHCNEYSYSIIFSLSSLDRVRFDNYDEKWDLTTNPNHFHPWGEEKAIASPMSGDPMVDMKILVDLINDGKLRSLDPKFD